MKKRLLSLIMAVMMVVVLVVPAAAATTDTNEPATVTVYITEGLFDEGGFVVTHLLRCCVSMASWYV